MSAAPVMDFANYVDVQPERRAAPVYQPQSWFIQPSNPKKGPHSVTESHLLWENAKREIPKDLATKGLDDTYVIEDRSSVYRFIEEHRLHGLLLQARQMLKTKFGEDSVKTLSVVSDEEGFESLFCLVTTKADVQRSQEALRSFDLEWWVPHAKQAAGRLNFDFKTI